MGAYEAQSDSGQNTYMVDFCPDPNLAKMKE
jgi:hypothetical protein